MHNQIHESQVTSHGKSSVGLNVLSSEEDPGDVSQHLLQQTGFSPFGIQKALESVSLVAALQMGRAASTPSGLPADCVPLVSIEQLADVLEDGNARKGWMLSKIFYEASGGADHTQTDAIISRCARLREFLDLKTGYKAPSAMNGGSL